MGKNTDRNVIIDKNLHASFKRDNTFSVLKKMNDLFG